MQRALVTGGGGFLGSAIVRLLRAQGVAVVSLSRGNYPALLELGVTCHQGDIADAATVQKAVAGCDTVFHVAAKAGVWGPPEQFIRSNVLGTRQVINACRELGVKRLVYTSSPSVVYNGQDQENVDESAPYPGTYLTDYPRTKAQAEVEVLAANDSRLATCSLRPHLIWGPGDNHLLPRLVARSHAGRLRRIGLTDKLVDSIYIDTAAEAHLLAAQRLDIGSPIAGKAYFISQGEPWPMWKLISEMVVAAGAPPVRGYIPVGVATVAGWVLEHGYRTLGWKQEPRLTRFVVKQLTTAHWYNIDAARRDFGFEPKLTMTDGLRRLAAWYRQQNATTTEHETETAQPSQKQSVRT